jgi:2-succinyl-6-hydroxy-2,4-cyclohexadiene-1-carboxylate synthase
MRVKTNQVELQVQDYEHYKDAIIFLHFSGANLMMWQRAIPFFMDKYRLILVDLRGHGKSDKPNEGYHMDGMARDVVGVMQELDIEWAHVVGSSLGAEVGLSLAANYPEKVISLVCDGALSSEYGPYGTWEGSKDEFNEYVNNFLEKMRTSPEKSYPSVDALVDKSRESLEAIGWWNEYVEAMERYDAFELEEENTQALSENTPRRITSSIIFNITWRIITKLVKCPLLLFSGEDVYKIRREKAAMQ